MEDAETENRLVDTVVEGEVGQIERLALNMHIQLSSVQSLSSVRLFATP